MKVYNEEKTQVIENPNLEKGYLKEDKILVRIVPEQLEIQKQSHYETIKEYPNGGKEVKEVVDVEYKPYVPKHEEWEDIQVYILYTEAELLERKKQALRNWRENCFKVIDRAVWYDSLTDPEKQEVKAFRQKLLDITQTLEKPTLPQVVAVEIKEN